MSRRLSASSRITAGVAHEVKNPINAIVLHLQLLQGKLRQVDPDTRRHMDIIGNEIHRLDRVVQILVDFTRPRELRLEEIDLRRILEEVSSLASPDAAQHSVTIERDLPEEPLMVKADSDFMKQAFLNVVLNGVQAMPDGGRLSISSRREDDVVVTDPGLRVVAGRHVVDGRLDARARDRGTALGRRAHDGASPVAAAPGEPPEAGGARQAPPRGFR
jgi:signal transduction histidine kinase